MHYNITNVGFYDAMSVNAVDFIMKQTELTTIFCEGGLVKKIVGMKKNGQSESLKNLVLYDEVDAELTKQAGDAAENAALCFLQQKGLRLLQRNYRTPGRGGGEIDLILQESDGTLVFVEVRKRAQRQFGGALGSVSRAKQRRIVFAARYYLWRWRPLPPTRFDVVAWEAEGMIWQKAAFDAEGW
jgi:putative endonuclease